MPVKKVIIERHALIASEMEGDFGEQIGATSISGLQEVVTRCAISRIHNICNLRATKLREEQPPVDGFIRYIRSKTSGRSVALFEGVPVAVLHDEIVSSSIRPEGTLYTVKREVWELEP